MKTKLLIALALIGISMSSATHAASYTDVFTLTGFSGSGINSSNHVLGDYNGRIGVFLANTNNSGKTAVSVGIYYEQDVYVCNYGGGSKQFMPLTKSGSDDNYRHPHQHSQKYPQHTFSYV